MTFWPYLFNQSLGGGGGTTHYRSLGAAAYQAFSFLMAPGRADINQTGTRTVGLFGNVGRTSTSISTAGAPYYGVPETGDPSNQAMVRYGYLTSNRYNIVAGHGAETVEVGDSGRILGVGASDNHAHFSAIIVESGSELKQIKASTAGTASATPSISFDAPVGADSQVYCVVLATTDVVNGLPSGATYLGGASAVHVIHTYDYAQSLGGETLVTGPSFSGSTTWAMIVAEYGTI